MTSTNTSSSELIGEKLAPFNPSSTEVIDLALEYLELDNCQDTLIDIGCGDGRFLLTAAKRSRNKSIDVQDTANNDRLLPCIGVEYDEKYVLRFKESIQQGKDEFLNLENQVTVIHGNALEVDLESLHVNKVFVYLVPSGLKLMENKLRGVLDRGGRVVSYMFSIPNMTPLREGNHKGTKVRLYTKDSIVL